MTRSKKTRPGAWWSAEKCRFNVWAPLVKNIFLVLKDQDTAVPMKRDAEGYWTAQVEGLQPGARYAYSIDGTRERPDPASFCQPEGVHASSAVVNHSFPWNDAKWKGISLEEMIIYELHTGTFTEEGTFDAIIPRLDELRELGINTIELMPVAQFPGNRNWGYDGVHPYAVQQSYGGVESLKRLVDACHRKEISVTLDVVYNHLGPEGNYLWDFGPYFTDRYQTPWNSAVNFDGPYSDGVRRFFIENALYWMREFHIDALRLDALHAVFDFSARHFLEELSQEVEDFSGKSGRKLHLIAESDLNDARLIRPRRQGGYQLDAQWCDDFHHSIRTLLTSEKSGYYADFGKVKHLAKAFRQSYVYDGEFSAFRKRRHGNSPKKNPASQFVVCSQNHDQVGNRMLGERLSANISFEGLKVAAGAVILSPYIPLLFMGEEYGETAPFPYFISHGDEAFVEAVREGRKNEFADFRSQGEPPDPQSEQTFRSSILNWQKRNQGEHAALLAFYKHLLSVRKTCPLFKEITQLLPRHRKTRANEKNRTLVVRIKGKNSATMSLFNFHPSQPAKVKPFPGRWKKLADSQEPQWRGPGGRLPAQVDSNAELLHLNPLSFAFYAHE